MNLVPPEPPLSDGEVALRPLDGRDIAGIAEALDDPDIIHRFGKSKLSPEEFLASKEVGWRDGSSAAFAICDADGRFVGQVFVEPGEAATAEIGYWLLPEGRGRGFAARAVQLVSRWAFQQLDLQRLSLWAEADNVPSMRVAERSGFVREGTLRSFRARHGKRFDVIIYSLLPSDVNELARS